MALSKEDTVVATFEEYDVEWRVDCDKVLEYIKENDLMDLVVAVGVDYMRDWYDNASGDAVWEATRYALRRVVGSKRIDELENGRRG